MSDNKRKSHARISYTPLKTPNTTPDPTIDREEWLKNAISGFVSPSATNKKYYAVILRTLWPEGHGIPGPIVDGSAIRKAIDNCHGTPYHDPFRRVRELQGEEGFLGIIKGGNSYQLIDLSISGKRIPRTHLNNQDWKGILNKYGNVCAACGRTQDKTGFQQDHKIPRLRGGSNDIENWQPLCDECNNFKSTACRDCHLDCGQCCWAYPEKYKPLNIPGSLVARLREYAKAISRDPNEIVITLITEKLEENE